MSVHCHRSGVGGNPLAWILRNAGVSHMITQFIHSTIMLSSLTFIAFLLNGEMTFYMFMFQL